MNFLIILLGHWVGDFVLQTSSMANEKGHSIKWLLLHVLLYTITLLVTASLVFSWQIAFGYTVISALLHLVTDFFTSKLAARFADKPRIFYPILGFDQLLHVACLYWAYLNADILAL
ncbi:DUF3307 domain-containing protein [Croceivirga thetidis]|uniref:DUF3307 domain-containing protein n=1 Tax=Croceivirga thetidis TaxID=2721623 RepID=A0ABX1GMZ6_9FLAO|nr:DUF3307 domain-containing protein [Croceivirga thetidis]NKI30461.1 DUF3307 domain-containing protein [Croceivirga thetidis]